jgi:hypothetical protein
MQPCILIRRLDGLGDHLNVETAFFVKTQVSDGSLNGV